MALARLTLIRLADARHLLPQCRRRDYSSRNRASTYFLISSVRSSIGAYQPWRCGIAPMPRQIEIANAKDETLAILPRLEKPH